MKNGTGRVRIALRVNAAFSGLCGLALLIAPGAWAELIGLPRPWALAVLGVGLAGFAALVARAAADVAGRRRLVTAIVAADVLWVAASPIAMAAGAGTLTAAGQALVAAVAGVVAALAAAQWRGLRAARTA